MGPSDFAGLLECCRSVYIEVELIVIGFAADLVIKAQSIALFKLDGELKIRGSAVVLRIAAHQIIIDNDPGIAL